MQKKLKEKTPPIARLLSELRQFVDVLALTDDVVQAVLPSGKPHDFESQLWDYKQKLPSLPPSATEEDRRHYKIELADIIKDVVSFHNAYGGYIIFGVSNKGSDRIVGCEHCLDVGDLNKRIHGYTDLSIECMYKLIRASANGDDRKIGLLLIPRRRAGVPPVKFRKEGPEKPSGGRAFLKETYVRIRDECRPAAASSEDWLFLHSDRNPTGAPPSSQRWPIKTAIPGADAELLEFVGRENSLAELRSWLANEKRPIRLITGIGGLGKTTLAYHFIEEVIKAQAGDIEWVIWLTAKGKTYSALRGKMVATGRVDFSDVESLYNSLLKVLHHEFQIEEEETDLEQLADRVVEALNIYCCLIVVDDIDSLQPDEQRETVAALNTIASRTIGRDVSPSKILMTSRIDQGLSENDVTKIRGLERVAFDKYVHNLCVTFDIDQIEGQILEDFFECTSGSPLFASSIVRLVKRGENLRTAVETWRGQEGEEVRRFAFEREVERLTDAQGRLLFAVLLLGETSVVDLASILDTTQKVVKDRVSELQAYHLLMTKVRGGDNLIIAPAELILLSEILRRRLGSQAESVQKACATAEERSRADNKSIGLGIRSILNDWDVGRFADAVVRAQALRDKFPKSGDIASILGAALLRTSPPQWREADKELETARRMGCARPELLVNIIRVKTELKDWPGLYGITKGLISNETSRDPALIAYLASTRELIKTAKDRGEQARVAELAIEAVEHVTRKTNKFRLESSLFQSLISKRFDFAREYINALIISNPRPGDKLRIFEGVFRLAESNVLISDLINVGLSALDLWWTDVEGRPILDRAACVILSKQLRRLEKIGGHC